MKMSENKVTVLVATYNNEKYIEELLNSLLSQTHKNLDIVIRDDGSSDGTLSVVEKIRNNDSRIRMLEGGNKSPGAMTNFFTLLINTDGEYTMFCDADDVWKEDKVERTLKKMLEGEQLYSKDTPILVHTDLTVVDENLNLISGSLFRYEKLSPERTGLKECLVQNTVTGCTLMINRALKEMVKEVPSHAVMHDWWLALVASAFGKIIVLNDQTVLYRQHQKNQVGAYNSKNLTSNFRRLINKERTKRIYGAMFKQAECFAETFNDLLDEKQHSVIAGYGEMQRLSKIKRIIRIIKGRYYKNTLVRNIGQFIVI